MISGWYTGKTVQTLAADREKDTGHGNRKYSPVLGSGNLPMQGCIQFSGRMSADLGWLRWNHQDGTDGKSEYPTGYGRSDDL